MLCQPPKERMLSTRLKEKNFYQEMKTTKEDPIKKEALET
jgi:hypothetical protein